MLARVSLWFCYKTRRQVQCIGGAVLESFFCCVSGKIQIWLFWCCNWTCKPMFAIGQKSLKLLKFQMWMPSRTVNERSMLCETSDTWEVSLMLSYPLRKLLGGKYLQNRHVSYCFGHKWRSCWKLRQRVNLMKMMRKMRFGLVSKGATVGSCRNLVPTVLVLLVGFHPNLDSKQSEPGGPIWVTFCCFCDAATGVRPTIPGSRAGEKAKRRAGFGTAVSFWYLSSWYLFW